jgi:glucokinase
LSAPPSSIIGLDLGGSKIACVEGTFDGRILARTEIPSPATAPFAQVLPALTALIRGRLAEAASAGRQAAAISVSVGGPLRIEAGVLIDPPHLPGWHHAPLKQSLAAAFPDIPVLIEHDGNAGAQAEFHFGVGRDRPGLEHLIFLTVGTGIGAGIIVAGRILRGASDTAGEVGHWRLSRGGPVGFGKQGSWEAFSSGAGMVALAAHLYPRRFSAATPIRTLVEAMLAGDSDALAVVGAAGERLGQGLALLIDAFNPQVIVLGSLAVALGERLLAPARRVVAAEALPAAVAACEILPSAFGAGIGDVAALMAAICDPAVARSGRARQGL